VKLGLSEILGQAGKLGLPILFSHDCGCNWNCAKTSVILRKTLKKISFYRILGDLSLVRGQILGTSIQTVVINEQLNIVLSCGMGARKWRGMLFF
jgi:hypothetical protein